MELVVVANNKEEIDKYKDVGIDKFIFGLEGYSVNYPELTLSEIKDLVSNTSIFVAINKNIFNSELGDLKDKLIELSNLNILGVLFYDLGVLNIVLENKLDIDLVWNQTHMVTNYNTCNYYYSKGVKYGYLANEITLDEKLEISENTDMSLMTQVFGYLPMSHSGRGLVTNYFKSIDRDKEKDICNIKDKNDNYLVKEKAGETTILSGKVVNGIKPLFTMLSSKIKYGVIDTQDLDFNMCLEVTKIFVDVLNNGDSYSDEKKEDIILKLNNMIGDYTGFYYQKTIYKVKKNEK